jgi:hypothetical protein
MARAVARASAPQAPPQEQEQPGRRAAGAAGPTPGAGPTPAQQAPPRPSARQPTRAAAPRDQGPGRRRSSSRRGFVPPAQPGNKPGFSPGGTGVPAGQAQGKQKGPREFVGPMDHSYRAVNGNVSTVLLRRFRSPAATATTAITRRTTRADPAVRADAVTRIFCFIEDLFFQAKIMRPQRSWASRWSLSRATRIVWRLTDLLRRRPTLLVFDLNNLNAKPMTLIPKFKTKLKKATSIVGFLNHLQGDLKMKAIEAGCDTVMPRSAFSQSLPNLLRRYGLEEEEEYYPQPVCSRAIESASCFGKRALRLRERPRFSPQLDGTKALRAAGRPAVCAECAVNLSWGPGHRAAA